MIAQTHRKLAFATASLAVASIAAAFVLVFKAGCAGDLKGGSSGDPLLALHLEGLALLPFLLGLAASTFVAWSVAGSGWARRSTLALTWFLFGGALLWLLGLRVQEWGTQACF